MNDEKSSQFSDVLAAQLKRLKNWIKPDPDDPLLLKIVKAIFKTIVLLVLLLFSPVLLIGFALIFIGLM